MNTLDVGLVGHVQVRNGASNGASNATFSLLMLREKRTRGRLKRKKLGVPLAGQLAWFHLVLWAATRGMMPIIPDQLPPAYGRYVVSQLPGRRSSSASGLRSARGFPVAGQTEFF